MAKKTTTKETSQSQGTTQASTPTWIQNGHQSYMDGVNALMGQGAGAFTPAGPNALQQSAFSGAQGLTTSPLYGQAADLANQAANAGASSAGPAQQATARNFTDVQLDPYMNNGLNGLLDAASADYAATGGRVNAAQAAQAAANGGARNSNNAIREAITQGELSRAANTGLSQLRYDAFNSAANLAQNDLNREAQNNQFNAGQANQMSQFNAGQQDNALSRMLAGAGLLGNLGQAQGQDERANIGLQAGMGDAQYQMDLMRQQYPLQFQQIMQSLSGFNPALYGGATNSQNTNSTGTTTTSDPMGSLGALLGGAGALFSPIKIPGFSGGK